jgi:hypothetical protein
MAHHADWSPVEFENDFTNDLGRRVVDNRAVQAGDARHIAGPKSTALMCDGSRIPRVGLAKIALLRKAV